MENPVTSTSQTTKAPTTPEKKGLGDRMRDIGRKLSNNVRLIDLYARGKDGYKIFEMMGPVLGALLPSNVDGSKPRDDEQLNKLSAQIGEHSDAKIKAGAIFSDLEERKARDEKIDETALSKADKKERYHSIQREIYDKQYHDRKEYLRPDYEYKKLKHNLIGDTLNFVLQWGISKFSSMSEKEMVVRTYENLARDELGINNREIKFKDLKRMKNPIVREAVDYYSKKSWYRSLPDFTGLIRWVPLIAFAAFPKLKREGGALSKTLWTIAQKVDGIKLLLGSKTAYFGWYFTNRQTGSFYQAENLWNKTEGITNPSNRMVNQNVLTGDFVNQLEVARLYEEFRKENPKMALEQYTPNDPLTSRIFEQTARYINHHYMADLYKINEPKKQDDLRDKNITHAMLVELIGSGGLKVQDAMGSALRLEVLAYHGRHGAREGIAKYREVSKRLEKIQRPDLGNYATQGEAVEGLRNYLAQIDSLGREYLSDFWPPKYIDEELKEGFIIAVFKGTEISDEKRAYIGSALFMRDQVKERVYKPSQTNPAAAFTDSARENAAERQRETQYRTQEEKSQKREGFTDGLTRKRPEDIINKPVAETDIQPISPTLH